MVKFRIRTGIISRHNEFQIKLPEGTRAAVTTKRIQGKSLRRTGNERRLGEGLELMRLLWALDHGLQSTSKRMAANLGITGPQRLVIRIVGRFPRISAGELAAILCVHPSTLTGILQRLEKRGVLHRKQDPHDGRRALLSLTPKGLGFDALRTGTVEAAVRRALTKMAREKIVSAREVLEALGAELLRDNADGSVSVWSKIC